MPIKELIFILIITLLVICTHSEAEDDNKPKINSGDFPVYANFK